MRQQFEAECSTDGFGSRSLQLLSIGAPSLARWMARLGEGRTRSALALADQIAVSAANFFLLISVARLSPTIEVGLFVLVLRTVDFLSELHTILIWSPFTILAPTLDLPQRRRYAGSVLLHEFVAIGIGAVLLLIVGVALQGLPNSQTAASVAFFAGMIGGATLLREFVRRFCFARLKVGHALIVDAVVLTLQIAVVGVLYFSNRFSVAAVIVATALSCSLVAVAYLVIERRNFEFSLADIVKDFRSGFSLGRWLLGADLALLLSNMLYPWLLAYLTGPVEVAIFSTALAITNIPRMFLICAQNLLLPQAAHSWVTGGRSSLRFLVRRSTTLLATGTLLFCVAMLFAGHWLPGLIYGSTFSGNGNLVFVLSLCILCTALTLAPTFALTTARRPDLNLRINMLGLAIHLSAGFLLVRSYGVWGAAYGLLLGQSVSMMVRWIIYRQAVPAQVEELPI